jgi:hypothetical protein
MTIDLDAFPPAVKLALIAVGEEFGSDDTFAQATQTGQGLEKYGDILQLYGLPLSDGKRLGAAREMLSEAGYGRNQAKGQKKTLGIGLEDANRAGRTVRIRGRSILTSTKSALSEQGQTEAATKVQTTLDATADSEKTGEELAKQLDSLAEALDPNKAPEAAKAAADRGGPEVIEPLLLAAMTLREAVKKKPTVRGTPAETQRLNQIDGIIVDICRRGRDAAKAASKDRGDPAILKAFKLDKLYSSPAKSA